MKIAAFGSIKSLQIADLIKFALLSEILKSNASYFHHFLIKKWSNFDQLQKTGNILKWNPTFVDIDS